MPWPRRKQAQARGKAASAAPRHLLGETVSARRRNVQARVLRQVHPGLPPLLVLSFCLVLSASACTTPVGVKRIDPRTVHRALTTNILSANTLSNPTQNVLYRRDLFTRFENDPEVTLADLHAEGTAERGGRDDICALAELSFFYAENTGKRSYYLASVVYAYTFLFPGAAHTPPDPFDPRFRLAADLYNRGITEG